MRAASTGLGAALVVAAAGVSGLGMTGHMTAHTLAVAVAAPLLALGLSGSRYDPSRRGGLAASPLALSVVELVAVWLWHVPAVRSAAGHGMLAQGVELACFLVAGWMLWSAVLARRAEGVGALLLTSMHMTLLGALIALAPRPLYPAMMHAAPSGLSPLQDQQFGGTVMLALGGVAYLAGGLAMLARLLRHEPVPA